MTCYDQVKLPKDSESLPIPFDDGKAREKSRLLEHTGDIEDLTKVPSLPSQQQSLQMKENDTPIAVSARQNKRTISSDKSNRSNKRTRNTKSSRTSGRASTSKEKDCYGWWTKSCEDMSKKLWCPTKTGCADLLSNSSNGYVTNIKQLSWSKIKKYVPQNKNSPKILWQSYTSSHADTMECDDTPKDLIRCQKIRLCPTTSQAKTLRQWMKAARDTYNQGLRLIKDGKAKPNRLLKKLVVTRRDTDNPKMQKMKETPADIRSRAILDLLDSFKTAHAGLKARKLRRQTQKSRWNKRKKKEKNLGRRRWRKKVAFHIKYKSKRLTSDSFGFEGEKSMTIKEKELFLFSTVKKFGMQDGIKMSEEPKYPIDKCCRIQYIFGRWYILLPYATQSEQKCRADGRVGALDPGIRTFQAYYTENECGEIAYDVYGMADKINEKIEGITKKIKVLKKEGANRKRINRLTRAWYRANARSSNLATDLHFKTIKFLFERFDVIIAPRLNSSSMLRRDFNLKKITKARMAFLRHGKFYNRLLMKAEASGKTILDLEEHGTSVTCSSCGHKNKDLGSSKNFLCSYCNFRQDRDVNSSKNHLLKALVGTQDY